MHPGPGWREWVLPAALFAATFLSTTFAGLIYVADEGSFSAVTLFALTHPAVLKLGLPFSITFLGILLAHEMGHFLACRYYGIKCTPPFFIPLPISIAGTLGAFIRIKSPFQHKKALFDVGIAGPLAGFALVIPALFVGIGNSELIPKGSVGGGLVFGEPLIFRMVGQITLGYSPGSQDMIAHPIAMAAWFGLLATCLNLLPIWQLDGGHIAYAVLGRHRQKQLSVAGAVGLVMISFAGWPIPSYLLFGALLLILGARFRFYHPPTIFDEEELGTGRKLLGAVALIVLLVSFTPVPISFS
jgi:membrane-associated protease RseP (regulator of RpoE activity)